MYLGQVYYNETPLTLEEAVEKQLITIDENNDVWLFQDTNHIVQIHGDLHLQG